MDDGIQLGVAFLICAIIGFVYLKLMKLKDKKRVINASDVEKYDCKILDDKEPFH